MKNTFYPILFIVVFIGCKKGTDPAPVPVPEIKCTSVTSIKATPAVTTIEKGQNLSFQADNLSGVSYTWKLPGGGTLTTAAGSVQNVGFGHEGWFYLEAKNTCNEIKKDSFYLDVTMPQGTGTCTPVENSISFSAANHTNSSFTNITQGETGITNDAYMMTAWGGGNELAISFHPSYKNNKQPENGVYTTGEFNANGNRVFAENDLDKVFVTNITYSPTTILYKSVLNQKVYITRVNGKLKATICSMAMAGSSNGTPYNTNVTLSITEK